MKRIIKLTMITLLILSLSACSDLFGDPPVRYEYEDYNFYQIESYSEQLYKSDESFYVYYYSVYCQGCERIRNDILGIITELKEDQLYLFDTGGTSEIKLEESFNLLNTPTLVWVKNNEYQEKYVGPTDILAVLKTLK